MSAHPTILRDGYFSRGLNTLTEKDLLGKRLYAA